VRLTACGAFVSDLSANLTGESVPHSLSPLVELGDLAFRDELDDLGALRGNQQCKTCGGDERHGPDQVQIHPGFSQNVETQLLVHHEGD
jgi:hypothetical protein